MESTETTSHRGRWDRVSPGDEVEVCLDSIRIHRGEVDLVAADGDVVWIIVSLGERRLFHKDDGYQLVKIQP